MINLPVTPIQTNSPKIQGRSPLTPHKAHPWMQSIGEQFAHLKVGRKIGYGYALALGVAALGASLGVLVGSRYQYQATMLEEQAQEEMQVISALQLNLLESRIHQQKLAALVQSPTAFQQEYDELRRHADIVQQNWNTLREFASESSHDHHATHDHDHQFPQLQTTYGGAIESYFLQLSMLANAIQQHSKYSSETNAALQEQLLEFSNHPVVGQIDQLVNELNASFEEIYEEYRQSEHRARVASQIQLRIILASAGVSIAIATALIYLTSRAIARPLETTTRIAQEVIQTGNFNLQIPITTQDEVGVLATSLNNLIQGFNHLLGEQKEAKDQLYSSQQLLKLVIDTLPQSIFWKDRNLVFLGCNQQLAHFAGMESPADLIGKTDYDLPWTEGEAHYLRKGDRRVMLSNRAELGLEATYTTADGKFRWLEINKVPLHDADGAVIGVLGTFQDITERKEAELKLQHLNQVLEQRSTELSDTLKQLKQSQMQLIQTEKMSSLGQLVAGVAHEINNPINFIHGNLIHASQYAQDLLTLVNLYQQHYPVPTQTIQDEIDTLDLEFLTTDLTRLLQSMRVGTDRIREIVLSLRTFSRLDEAEVKNVNLHEGIDSTLTILHHRLKENSTNPEILIVKDYGALPLIECYAGQLNQVFMNLLSNAIDALEESFIGRPYQDIAAHPGQIRIRTELLDSKWVAIHIADNGPGMSDATRDRLFDPFFTTKPVGKGTGLGLSISHQIITEKHRGNLYCYSIPGKGTEFTIKLPTRRVLP